MGMKQAQNYQALAPQRRTKTEEMKILKRMLKLAM
jgi:hypothetical protein